MRRLNSIRRSRALLAALAFCSMTAAPALAASTGSRTLEAREFDRMARVFASHGYDLRKSDGPERMFEGKTDSGVKYVVTFYGGNDGAENLSIQFFAYWDGSKNITLAELNQWNAAKRWVRAYVDDENDLCIAMDVTMLHGVTEDNLADWAGVFEMMAEDFASWYDEAASD